MDVKILTHISCEADLATKPIYSTIAELADDPMKPKGFWFSVNGGWEDWCTSEWVGRIANRHRYDVTLGEEHLLVLDEATVRTLHRRYPGRQPGHLASSCGYIDWRAIADDYDGVIAAPYLWHLRLEPRLLWYYGWDCDSGCIWQPRGVTITYRDQLSDDPDLSRPYDGPDDDEFEDVENGGAA